MNKAWWLPLAVALMVTSAMVDGAPAGADDQGPVKEFVLALPEGIEGARRVVLELTDVRLPRNQAAVFRARAIDENGAEVPLGSVGMLAESNDAQGLALHAALRIEITNTLKRWCQDHPGASVIRIRVVPHAGKEPLAALEWSTGAAELRLVAP